MAEASRLTRWPGSPALAEALAAYAAVHRDRIPDDLDLQEVRDTTLPGTRGRRLTVLSTVQCGPHVDETHRPWTVLAILAAGPSHRIGCADRYRPEGDPAPDLTGCTIAEEPAQAGDIVLLNIHHVHWLSSRPDERPLHALCLDRDRPYSQAEAESAILDLIVPGAPPCR